MHVILDPYKPPDTGTLACFVCLGHGTDKVEISTTESEWNGAQDSFPPESWCIIFGGAGRAGGWGRVFVGVCESHKAHANLINSMKVVPISFQQIMSRRLK